MSCFRGCFLAIVALAFTAQSAAATTLFFDFGFRDSPSAAANYNDVIFDNAPGGLPQPIELFNTIDSTGASTGIGLSLFNFHSGANPNGTLVPSGDAAHFVSTATQDNAYTHESDWSGQSPNPRGSVVLTGLNDSIAYNFTFFASRIGANDNRETMYTVTGANSAVSYLNASGNVSNVATVADIFPNAGSITINVEAGPNNNNGATRFAYLGTMSIEYDSAVIPEPGSLVILSAAGALLAVVRPRRLWAS